jgi:hypothetical protein
MPLITLAVEVTADGRRQPGMDIAETCRFAIL